MFRLFSPHLWQLLLASRSYFFLKVYSFPLYSSDILFCLRQLVYVGIPKIKVDADGPIAALRHIYCNDTGVK